MQGEFTILIKYHSLTAEISQCTVQAAGDFCAEPRDYIEKESSSLGIDRGRMFD